MRDPAIRNFVKGTLGCTCPEEVFKEIRYETNVNRLPCQSPVSRIELGNRLLIYILVSDDPDVIERDLPIILRYGKKERDSLRFNRFRAVVCTDNIGAVANLADDVFARQTMNDQKVHLHVVAREENKAMLEPTAID